MKNFLYIILFTVLISFNIKAQDLTRVFPSNPITFNVEYDSINNYYVYEYSFNENEFEGGKNLSNFYFKVCDEVEIFNVKTDNVLNYKIEKSDHILKFDNIKSKGKNLLYFSFNSYNIPIEGYLTFKHGKYVETIPAMIPSCNIIPESNILLLGSLSLIPFLIRKRYA
jgi:hypothetical protein